MTWRNIWASTFSIEDTIDAMRELCRESAEQNRRVAIRAWIDIHINPSLATAVPSVCPGPR